MENCVANTELRTQNCETTEPKNCQTQGCERNDGELQNGDPEQVRTEPPCLEDLERIDQLIGCFFPIALETEKDFNRALKAAYLMLELLDIKSELLVNLAQDYREFFLPL